jgi:predicted transcriptional regulator
MNRIGIYIFVAFFCVSGTWVANKYQLRKIVKPLKRHIENLKTDSVKKAYLVNELSKSDSVKSDMIAEMQVTFQDLARQNRALKAWKTDAEDGVIIKHDTVRVGIFGKIKKRK